MKCTFVTSVGQNLTYTFGAEMLAKVMDTFDWLIDYKVSFCLAHWCLARSGNFCETLVQQNVS